MRAALLGVLLMAACVGCATQSLRVEGLPNLHGFATCVKATGQNISFVRTDIYGTITGHAVVAHERRHEQQYLRFPSCAAFYRHYATPAGRLHLEAEAFAVGWCVLRKHGADTALARRQGEESLNGYFAPGHMPMDSIQRTFARFRETSCP